MASSLAVNQELTRIFIADDPTVIEFITHTRVKAPSGAYSLVSDPLMARGPLTVKFVFQGGTNDGITKTDDGAIRKYDFVVVAEHDADIRIDDVFFEAGKPLQKWVVKGLLPYNGYEVKAGIVSYGGDPGHG